MLLLLGLARRQALALRAHSRTTSVRSITCSVTVHYTVACRTWFLFVIHVIVHLSFMYFPCFEIMNKYNGILGHSTRARICALHCALSLCLSLSLSLFLYSLFGMFPASRSLYLVSTMTLAFLSFILCASGPLEAISILFELSRGLIGTYGRTINHREACSSA